ncbi:MAG: chemoreceptor glutamine deamidase CheD [Nevskia sp.]|nr:chemoreceptor glutamine deamidase CheD [Nevskia sp.]
MYVIRKARQAGQSGDGTLGGYYDPKFGAHAIKVLPGEYIVTGEDVMLVTLLGSCVSACIRDPLSRIGGMNHFMLPDRDSGDGGSARYGAYAMEMLINDLLKRGAARDRLEAKVFGGGAVMATLSSSNVGERNVEFVKRYLSAESIPVVAQDLGDTCPRRVHYFPSSGRVMLKRLPTAQKAEVVAGETLYQTRLRQEPSSGGVELFS